MILQFGRGEEFRIAPNSRAVAQALATYYTPFLLALHTNLAADVAKLGVARARGGNAEAVGNQNNYSRQPGRLLHAATAVRYDRYFELVAIERN